MPTRYTLILAAFLLSGCADPLTFSIISNGLDFISYAGSGKTTKDHALSVVTEKDCKLFRVLEDDEDICQEVKENADSAENSRENDPAEDG